MEAAMEFTLSAPDKEVLWPGGGLGRTGMQRGKHEGRGAEELLDGKGRWRERGE